MLKLKFRSLTQMGWNFAHKRWRNARNHNDVRLKEQTVACTHSHRVWTALLFF